MENLSTSDSNIGGNNLPYKPKKISEVILICYLIAIFVLPVLIATITHFKFKNYILTGSMIALVVWIILIISFCVYLAKNEDSSELLHEKDE